MESMRERIARAMYEREKARSDRTDFLLSEASRRVIGPSMEAWEEVGEMYLGDADAVLDAMREPTEGMVQAACDATFGPDPMAPETMHKRGWSAMIDAAKSQ